MQFVIQLLTGIPLDGLVSEIWLPFWMDWASLLAAANVPVPRSGLPVEAAVGLPPAGDGVASSSTAQRHQNMLSRN